MNHKLHYIMAWLRIKIWVLRYSQAERERQVREMLDRLDEGTL